MSSTDGDDVSRMDESATPPPVAVEPGPVAALPSTGSGSMGQDVGQGPSPAAEQGSDGAVQLFGTGAPVDPHAEYCGLSVSTPLVGVFGALWLLALVFCLYDAAAIDLLSLLCLAPSAVLAAVMYYRRRDTIPVQQLFVRYVFAFLLLGMLWWFALFWMLMLDYLFYNLFFRALGGLGEVLSVLLFYASMVGIEEGMKLALVRSQDSLATLPRAPMYPAYSAATALGLGSSISFTIVLFLRRIIDVECDSDRCRLTPLDFVIIVVFCCVLLQPVQLLSSYHLGLAAARLHVLKQRISLLGPFGIVIGFRTLCVIAFFVLLGVWPWLSLFGTLLVTAVYFVFVKRYEAQMPRSYLLAVGSLNTFGYGMIGGDEDELTGMPPPGTVEQPSDVPPQTAVAVDVPSPAVEEDPRKAKAVDAHAV